MVVCCCRRFQNQTVRWCFSRADFYNKNAMTTKKSYSGTLEVLQWVIYIQFCKQRKSISSSFQASAVLSENQEPSNFLRFSKRWNQSCCRGKDVLSPKDMCCFVYSSNSDSSPRLFDITSCYMVFRSWWGILTPNCLANGGHTSPCEVFYFIGFSHL